MTISLIFFASPDIALPSFEKLLNSPDFEVKALVTQPPKPAKRGKKIQDSNVKKLAMSRGIDVLEPVKIAKDEAMIEKLKSYHVDFFVTFAFGQILSAEALAIPKFQTINLHASLLPKYRGANPICAALLSGDSVTGITTMVTVLELDAGDICLKEEISGVDKMDFPTLSREIAEKSPDLIMKTLHGLYDGTLKPLPQRPEEATFTSKLKKEDKELDFRNPVKALHNRVRALCGVNTCHFLYNSKIIKVLKTDFCENLDSAFYESFKPGEVISVEKQGITVKCGDGAILIKSIKPEGKSEMPAYAWSLGSKIKSGDIVGC